MIPTLPEGMDAGDLLEFYDKLSGNLTDQSTIHVHWWTHRQNPSVCWICDLITLQAKILDLSAGINPKFPVDIRTSNSQEEDSDSEIETLNIDEERTPEYDTEEEGMESTS